MIQSALKSAQPDSNSALECAPNEAGTNPLDQAGWFFDIGTLKLTPLRAGMATVHAHVWLSAEALGENDEFARVNCRFPVAVREIGLSFPPRNRVGDTIASNNGAHFFLNSIPKEHWFSENSMETLNLHPPAPETRLASVLFQRMRSQVAKRRNQSSFAARLAEERRADTGQHPMQIGHSDPLHVYRPQLRQCLAV